MLGPAKCPCGRWFGSIAALDQHQVAKGHVGTARSEFAHAGVDRFASGDRTERHQDRAVRLRVLQRRRAAGEALDLPAEARSFGLTVERLVATLDAWDRSLKSRAA